MRSKIVSRTCGSVRRSLSAPARLATVGSEAAETTSLHRQDEEAAVRWFPRLRASTRSERQGWMKCPTQVNCQRHRKIQRAKDADRLKPNGNAASVLRPCKRSTRTKPAAGVEAGANSSMSSQPNIINPTCRLWERQAYPQGTLTAWRAEDAGKSQRRSITERIGVATLLHRANGQTSSGSFVTR